MFLLDNIKEEPETGAKETTKAGDSEKNDIVRMISFSTSSSGVSSQSAVAKTQAAMSPGISQSCNEDFLGVIDFYLVS